MACNQTGKLQGQNFDSMGLKKLIHQNPLSEYPQSSNGKRGNWKKLNGLWDL